LGIPNNISLVAKLASVVCAHNGKSGNQEITILSNKGEIHGYALRPMNNVRAKMKMLYFQVQ